MARVHAGEAALERLAARAKVERRRHDRRAIDDVPRALAALAQPLRERVAAERDSGREEGIAAAPFVQAP